MSDTDSVVIEPGPVTVVRINRPDRGNSVTPLLANQLANAFAEVGRDESTTAVVLTGTASMFCTGADLVEMREKAEADGYDDLVDYIRYDWMTAVQRMMWNVCKTERITVAAINGPATAGGLDLALCCDYRVAAKACKFGESYVKLGLVPAGGGSFLLPRLVGGGLARRLLVTGEVILGEKAHEIGLVDEVVDDREEVVARSIEVAAELSKEPATVAALKRIMWAGMEQAFAHNLHLALEENRALLLRPSVQDSLKHYVGGFGSKSGKA